MSRLRVLNLNLKSEYQILIALFLKKLFMALRPQYAARLPYLHIRHR